MADSLQHRAGAPLPLPTAPRGPASFRSRLAVFTRRHKLAPYFLILPALAGIALVLLWPLIQVVIYSFQNYGIQQANGVLPTQWVGFANFTSIFRDPEFWLALRITVLFALVV